MKTVFIYALNCPITGRTRYVGKAADPYARYEEHLNYNLREKTHKACWIRSVLATGENLRLEILDEVPELEWQLWECEWIRLYRALGFRLTNATDGGDGVTNPTFEHREKIRLAHRNKKPWNFGKKMSEESRLNNSLAQRGKIRPTRSVEYRRKISINMLEIWKSRREKHASNA